MRWWPGSSCRSFQLACQCIERQLCLVISDAETQFRCSVVLIIHVVFRKTNSWFASSLQNPLSNSSASESISKLTSTHLY